VLGGYLGALGHLPLWQVYLIGLAGLVLGLFALVGVKLLRNQSLASGRNDLASSQSASVRRFLQADSPTYVAHAELRSADAPTVVPPGRFIIDVTNVPSATIGDVLDPISLSFSPALPVIQLQYFDDNRTPVAQHIQNIHTWYSLVIRPVKETGPAFTTLTLVFEKDISFHQVKVEFSTPSLLPVNEVKYRNQRFLILAFMGAIPSGTLHVSTTR